jgi:hypothetical protein
VLSLVGQAGKTKGSIPHIDLDTCAFQQAGMLYCIPSSLHSFHWTHRNAAVVLQTLHVIINGRSTLASLAQN